jgi:hypothetical protein
MQICFRSATHWDGRFSRRFVLEQLQVRSLPLMSVVGLIALYIYIYKSS